MFFLVNYPRYQETPISPARTTCACREHYEMTLQSDNSVFLWFTLFYLVVFPLFFFFVEISTLFLRRFYPLISKLHHI